MSAASFRALVLGCALFAAPAAAQDAAPVTANAVAEFPMTAQGAADFVAAAEKDLFDFTTEASRIQWVNATYITDDTDALAAAYGAEFTEKQVHYALEAAKYARVSGLDPVVSRKLDWMAASMVIPSTSFSTCTTG